MRTRTINREFWISNNVAVHSYFERLLFIALWGLADRAGLVLNRADRIKAEAFALDMLTSVQDVERGVEALQRAGLIQILEAVDGNVMTCIYIPNFLKYQDIHPHEMKSKLECNYISGHVSECPSQTPKPSHPSQPSRTSQKKNPPTPQGGSVREVIEYLNQVTGRGFSLDLGNKEIEKALKRGATVDECKEVIDRCWAKWKDSPDFVGNVNKVVPFRACHFDAYLDEWRAGKAKTAKPKPKIQEPEDHPLTAAERAAAAEVLSSLKESGRLPYSARAGG
jgi:uncharacterized phage protein (TIGR02220 family)